MTNNLVGIYKQELRQRRYTRPFAKTVGASLSNLERICLFDLFLYVPSTIFQLYRDGSSWVEPVLS